MHNSLFFNSVLKIYIFNYKNSVHAKKNNFK
jgi:hypothetical protein